MAKRQFVFVGKDDPLEPSRNPTRVSLHTNCPPPASSPPRLQYTNPRPPPFRSSDPPSPCSAPPFDGPTPTAPLIPAPFAAIYAEPPKRPGPSPCCSPAVRRDLASASARTGPRRIARTFVISFSCLAANGFLRERPSSRRWAATRRRHVSVRGGLRSSCCLEEHRMNGWLGARRCRPARCRLLPRSRTRGRPKSRLEADAL